MSKAYLLNALVAYSILGGLSAKLWRAASPLFIFAIRHHIYNPLTHYYMVP